MNVFNGEVGVRIDSMDLSYEEQVMIFGKPIADQLKDADTSTSAEFVVSEVDHNKQTVTLTRVPF